MNAIIDSEKPAGSEGTSSERLAVALVASQHQEVASLILAVMLAPLYLMYIAYNERQVSLVIISTLLLSAGGIRVAATLLYRQFGWRTSPQKIKFWKAFTIATVLIYSTMLGLFAYVAIAETDDYRLHLVVIGVVAAYAAGTVGRNAGLQEGITAQLITTLLLLAAALAQKDDYVYRTLSVFVILFLMSLRSISLSVFNLIFSLFRSNEEKIALLQVVTEKSERFDGALSNMPQGLAMVDADYRAVVVNKKLRELLGLQTIEDNAPIAALFELSARNGVLPPESISELIRDVHDSATGRTQREIEIDTVNGQTLEITFQPMSRAGSVVIVTDVTHKKALDRITHLAHHDTLTGLPNRMYFEKRFAATVAAAEQRNERIAIMALDLDRFKSVNDTLGHQVGDELLMAVATRVQGRLRAEDFVSRIGGDEFMLIHDNATGDSAEKLAHRLIKAVSAPYEIEGNQIVIGLSVGIAYFPEDGGDAAELLRNADIALYQAKNAGRGVFRLFEHQMAGDSGLRKAV